jgi:hypothetical protein
MCIMRFYLLFASCLLLASCSKDDVIAFPTIAVEPEFEFSIKGDPEEGQHIGTVAATVSPSTTKSGLEYFLIFTITQQSVPDALNIDATTGELTVNNPEVFTSEIRNSVNASVSIMPAYIKDGEPYILASVKQVEVLVNIDEPDSKIVIGEGLTISLEGANLYLNEEDSWLPGGGDGAHTQKYRTYSITDGTYTSGSFWALSSYTGGSYIIHFQIYVQIDGTFDEGEYPIFGSWNDVGNIGNWVWGGYYSSSLNVEVYASQTTGTLKITGGLEADQQVIFRGAAQDCKSYGSSEGVSLKLYFSGIVDSTI